MFDCGLGFCFGVWQGIDFAWAIEGLGASLVSLSVDCGFR